MSRGYFVSVKVTVSLIMAVMLFFSDVAGPAAALAASVAEENISRHEVTINDYYAVIAAISLIDQAAVLLRDPALAIAASDMKNAAKTAAALAGPPSGQGAGAEEDDESLWYLSDIPMKKEHQKLLWECCKERGLDYIDMLALISVESNFEEKCVAGKYMGYFQLSKDHGPTLSKQLNTKNDPLDGTINIIWGTAFYSWILDDKRVKGLEGKAKRDAALSIYQRGPGGYDKYGLNQKYLERYYKKRDKIVELFESRESK